MIDATLYVGRDGAIWEEAHWIEQTTIDSPMPKLRIVAIRDGTGQPRPLMCWVACDRPTPLDSARERATLSQDG